MHKIPMIIQALLRKNAGPSFTLLAMFSVTTATVMAQGSSSGTPVSEALPKNQVVATITVGSFPYGVVVSPDNSTVYVVDSGSKQVSVIDAATNAVTTTITVGSGPEFAAISPKGDTLYVTNYPDATVSVISTAANAVTNTLDVGLEPQGIAVSPNGEVVFVADYSGAVSVIATATNQVTSIPVAGNPYLVNFSLDGKQAYIVNSAGLGFISLIDVATETVSKKVLAGGEIYAPQSIEFSPDGETLYVSDQFDYVAALSAGGALKNAVLVVPEADLIDNDYVGQSLVTPNGKYVYVSNYTSSDVVMFSASDHKLTGPPITTGSGPFYMGMAPNGKSLYVANYTAGTVTVIDIAP
jgi:YVTN family beta-propeller protein